jgi:CheY-like chemotaxis protein
MQDMLRKPLSSEAAEEPDCQAEKFEIVGRLTGGIVHDFNNVLTVIIGCVEILGEAVADRPELAAVAGLVAEAAARGADLTSYLLAFARGQPSRPRDVDVNALLVEAARLLRPALGGQIEICTIPARDVAHVWLDPGELMTVLLRLAVIARDAVPDGGKLVLESRSAEAGGVTITVKLSGAGISADDQRRTFADLSLARDFARRAGGRIEVYRQAGRETSVEIHLPRARELPWSDDEVSRKAGIEGGDEAVLVVDDDVLVRKYVVGQIQSLGYRTLAAGNASEALAIIDENAMIDLLLTDVMMPGSINGRQLAVEALLRRPALKVLYTSGYSENAMVDDGYLDASVLLLAKPYRKVDLAKMIRAALAA